MHFQRLLWCYIKDEFELKINLLWDRSIVKGFEML